MSADGDDQVAVRTRASGKTPGEEEAEVQAAELEAPFETAVLPEERTPAFDRTGFSRMRMYWRPEDAEIRRKMRAKVDELVLDAFLDAFMVADQIWDLVRQQEVDEVTGELRFDSAGNKVWKRLPGGGFAEDWTRLDHAEREGLLFTITMNLLIWKQRVADFQSDALFAKAKWTEMFAGHFDRYDGSGKGTVDARNAHANVHTAQDRYFALYVSWLASRANAIVATMEVLGQRLKDVLVR